MLFQKNVIDGRANRRDRADRDDGKSGLAEEAVLEQVLPSSDVGRNFWFANRSSLSTATGDGIGITPQKWGGSAMLPAPVSSRTNYAAGGLSAVAMCCKTVFTLPRLPSRPRSRPSAMSARACVLEQVLPSSLRAKDFTKFTELHDIPP